MAKNNEWRGITGDIIGDKYLPPFAI